MSTIKLGHTETFRDVNSFDSSVTIDTHSPDVDHMAFGIKLHHRNENVLGAESVIGVSIVDCVYIFHGVGSGLQFCEVNDDIGFELFENFQKKC